MFFLWSYLVTDMGADGSYSNYNNINISYIQLDYAFTNGYIIELHDNTHQYTARKRLEYH